MRPELLKLTLQATRAALIAAIAGLDSALEALTPPEPPASEPLIADPDPAVCQHPIENRKKTPLMGHVNAWVCSACGTEGGKSDGQPDR